MTDVVERHPIEVLTRVDLVVRGGRLVSPSGIISAGLAVRGGGQMVTRQEGGRPR